MGVEQSCQNVTILVKQVDWLDIASEGFIDGISFLENGKTRFDLFANHLLCSACNG